MADIAGNVEAIRSIIAAACRRAGRLPDQVRLIAVTKEQTPGVLLDLAKAGLLDFGENRVEHLAEMHQRAPQRGRFHAIGRLQSRYLPKLAPLADCIHSLCDLDHVARLNTACERLGRRMDVFLQANTSGEMSKAGVAPGELTRLLDVARAAPCLQVVGLMTMAPAAESGVDAGTIRRSFHDLRLLAQRHGLERLSMGMSDDFEIAIEEGATDVRIGRRLFA
jgi:pyridoxal phosphate enzyme (YggS family)